MYFLKDVVILLVGFLLLVKGADYFVEGSSSVAKKLRIPSVIVGLTIVAMGTSLPELSVSLISAMKGSNEIAISNVVGSNMFNLIVVLGACALICPVTVDKKIMKMDFPFSIVVTVLMLFLGADSYVFSQSGYDKTQSGVIGRLDGGIFLIVFVAFIAYTVVAALKERKNIENEGSDKELSMLISIIYIVGGVAAIKFGGDFVVDGAKGIAFRLGMTETLVGLTIVAVGTSLPELVTSVVAAKKGETGLAIGNVIGSNIFNVLFILGISGAICPIAMASESLVDLGLLIAGNVIVYVFAWSRDKINKKEGLVMVLMYVAYMAYAIMR